jgi:hypothetical protein
MGNDLMHYTRIPSPCYRIKHSIGCITPCVKHDMYELHIEIRVLVQYLREKYGDLAQISGIPLKYTLDTLQRKPWFTIQA